MKKILLYRWFKGSPIGLSDNHPNFTPFIILLYIYNNSKYCVARNIVDTLITYLNMIVGDGPLLVDTRERGKELVFPSLQHAQQIC